MTPTITTAGREEYLGHALEAAIRSRIADRRWYRTNRFLGWRDYEAETNRELRLLFSVRRIGIVTHRDEERRIAATFAHTIAQFEANMLEMAELMEADTLANGLPDVPVALIPWANAERRAMWGEPA